MLSQGQKVRYLQAYIHFRKGMMINIQLPRNARQDMLLEHLYTQALGYMNSIGKKINID